METLHATYYCIGICLSSLERFDISGGVQRREREGIPEYQNTISTGLAPSDPAVE